MTALAIRVSSRSHLVRMFLADYARNPVNLVVLALVPAVFVLVAAKPIADAAVLLGGSAPSVEVVTAGWAAAFLAGVAMYFQARAAREADRRLVLAGLRPLRLVAARLTTGLTLAVVVSAVALVALAIRPGFSSPLRTIVGTLMFAVIYLAIGALTGALVRNAVNGTVLIMFIWIVDVFLGPALTAPGEFSTRWMPTHFVTLWMADLPYRHGGRLGDLGWAVAWTVCALVVSTVVVTMTTRSRQQARAPSVTDTRWSQFVCAIKLAVRAYRRNTVLWVLLVIVPVVFILLAWATTPDGYMTLTLTEGGQSATVRFWLPDVHAGTMTPLAVASLSALVGLFVILDNRTGDHRLILAGYNRAPLLASRLALIGTGTLLVSGVALGTAAVVFGPRQLFVWITGSALLAMTYGLIGVCLGPLFGRVSGVFMAFLVPFLDIGIGQSPMLRPEPAPWARFTPGYGANRVLMDGALTGQFDEFASLGLALAWLAGLTLVASLLFRRTTQ